MGVNLSYFFNHLGTLAEVGADIGKAIGCRLEPFDETNDYLFCRLLTMEFSLYPRDRFYDCDQDEINYTSFRYEIETRTGAGSNFRQMQIEFMSMVPAIFY